MCPAGISMYRAAGHTGPALQGAKAAQGKQRHPPLRNGTSRTASPTPKNRGGLRVMISYEKLWATMKEKGVSQYALIKKYGVSPGQITRMKRNESVSTHTIEVFCKILDCDVGDIMEYIAEDK